MTDEKDHTTQDVKEHKNRSDSLKTSDSLSEIHATPEHHRNDLKKPEHDSRNSSVTSSVADQDFEQQQQPPKDEHHESGDEIYTRFSPTRKILIVSILCLCSFMSPISSTSVLAASPQVVATFSTTGTIFGVSNALYIVGMGISPLIYGPIGQHCGRKPTLMWSAIFFAAFSLGTALSPNLAAYFVFRILTALNGTSFFITGGAVVGDIYRPVDRGTAYGWFLSGTLVGPALGPVLGGIIVTYGSWRDIFWMQTGMAGLAAVCTVLFLPETCHVRHSDELAGLPRRKQAKILWSWINPSRVLVVLFSYPNLLVAGLGTGSLVWNMYSLLTPIQYVLNPRFGLTTPLQGGLFYIAPGGGYLIGTFIGGRWADVVVKRYIKKRGHRIAEDRLHSCWTAMGVIMPACMLIYGWTVEFKVGGIPVPVIAMLVQGAAQTFCFASINTYCIDVMQKRSSEVVAGNYVVRYIFAAAGTAACLPVIERIGVGWFSTISAAFLIVGTAGIVALTKWGKSWRELVDERKRMKGQQ